MKKRFFAICSVLITAILLVALVPGCDGTTPAEATIEVNATLCGEAWQGDLTYVLTATGEDDVEGEVVPGSHTVAPGEWTVEPSLGGPVGGILLDITPLATQTVAANGTITFTVNFEQGQDAWVEFLSWTRDGVPISNEQPDNYLDAYIQGAPHAPFFIFNEGTVLDMQLKQGVDGCPGVDVSVNESLAIYGYYLGSLMNEYDPLPGILHVANNLCAVEKVPDEEGARCEKLGDQVATWWGTAFPACTELEFGVDTHNITAQNLSAWDPEGSHYYIWDPGINLDEHGVYGLEKGVNYTKSIRWLSMWVSPPEEECVMFSLTLPPDVYLFLFRPGVDVYLLGDEDIKPENNELGLGSYTNYIIIMFYPM